MVPARVFILSLTCLIFPPASCFASHLAKQEMHTGLLKRDDVSSSMKHEYAFACDA